VKGLGDNMKLTYDLKMQLVFVDVTPKEMIELVVCAAESPVTVVKDVLGLIMGMFKSVAGRVMGPSSSKQAVIPDRLNERAKAALQKAEDEMFKESGVQP
jgi:hypothetical protein